MDAEIKKKWVAALRSGDFEQGTGGLKQLVKVSPFNNLAAEHVQHCCLGVLQEVLGTPQWRGEEQTSWFFGDADGGVGDYHHGFLTEPVLAKAGLPDDAQHKLASMNDQGKSFAEIADYIDQNL